MRKSIAAAASAFIASLALAFVLTLPVPAASTAPSSPAMWKMEGPNGRVFLFGSFHILPQGMVWRTPALEAAINSAQQFVFELDIDEVKNPLLMMGMTAKFGMLPKGESLHRLLAPERRKQFDDVVTALRRLGAGPLHPQGTAHHLRHRDDRPDDVRDVRGDQHTGVSTSEVASKGSGARSRDVWIARSRRRRRTLSIRTLFLLLVAMVGLYVLGVSIFLAARMHPDGGPARRAPVGRGAPR